MTPAELHALESYANATWGGPKPVPKPILVLIHTEPKK